MNETTTEQGFVWSWQANGKRLYVASVDGMTVIPTDDHRKAMPFGSKAEAEEFYPKIGGLIIASLELMPRPQLMQDEEIERKWNEEQEQRERIHQVLRAIPAGIPGHKSWYAVPGLTPEIHIQCATYTPHDYIALGDRNWKREKSKYMGGYNDWTRVCDNGVVIRLEGIELIEALEKSVSPLEFAELAPDPAIKALFAIDEAQAVSSYEDSHG